MKINKVLIILLIGVLFITGCINDDVTDSTTLLTTNYPIEYLVTNIYHDKSKVSTIYPKGINIDEYKITKKQEREFAKNTIFIYDGLTHEKDIAASLLNNNKNLKLIDVTKGMTTERDEEELWLSPANFLMLAGNIYNSLDSEILSTIIKQNLETNYNEVKLQISKYDADLKNISANGSNTIIAGNDVFEFLEKYGFNVLSLEKNDYYDPYEKEYARNGIIDKSLKYVFVLDTDEISENVKEFEELGATIIKVKSMKNLSESDASDGVTYITMMNEFIEHIREEAYN